MTQKKNKKFTLADLKPKAEREVEIEHPHLGKVGATVRICSAQSSEYLEAFLARQDEDFEGKTLTEKLRINAALAVSCIKGWNEELFEQEFSKEYALDLLSQPEMSWLLFGIQKEIEDIGSFFQD